MAQVVGRFAPTPSGYLHLGNLFCSLIAWLAAKSQGGKILLRNEDLDIDRTRPEYFLQAQRDLEALGLFWDEGGDASGPHAPYDQSHRSGFYTQQLHKLEDLGLVYPCFCSRAQLHAASAPHASDGEPIYAGTCRHLTPAQVEERSKTRSPALRLQVPEETVAFTDLHYGLQEQDLPTGCGDFILRRSDGVFAYQLAVVADDGAMRVTQVVRGRDLLSSTPRQILLYRLLGYPVPEFGHTPLVLASDGRRLSKRDGDQSLSGLRSRGYTPADVVGILAYLGGLLPEPMAITPQELLPLFSWEKLPREDICVPGWVLGEE
ncbi:MAG: tRNA glutamyl-Q(34) synthetase GluQRS [Acutalibacter sp.]|jgi:glutamyl-tRNA synthetase